MKTPKQIRNEEPTGYRRGFIDGHKEAEKSIKEMIEDWKRNSILKYDDDCPYCQRHISNTIIQAKELLSKIGEEKQDE